MEFVLFLFQGQDLDSETDLCYNRFRYYSPQMEMYISSDPIGLAGNNPILYGYVQDIDNIRRVKADVFVCECNWSTVKLV